MTTLRAVHESSHQVGAWCLGNAAGTIRLTDDGGEHEPPGELAPDFATWLGDVLELPQPDRRAVLTNKLAVLLAGPAGEGLLTERTTWDFTQDRVAVFVARNIWAHPDMQRLFRDVQRRLGEPAVWSAVLALADELDRRGSLGPADVEQVLTPRLTRGLWIPSPEDVR